MDLATLVVDLMIVLWFAAVIVGVLRAWQARPPRLAPLSAYARNKYTETWGEVARRFVHEPAEAARQADVLVSSVLRARGHPLDYERLPASFLDARGIRLEGEQNGRTESLRQALVRYRTAFDEALGKAPREETTKRRREMA